MRSIFAILIGAALLCLAALEASSISPLCKEIHDAQATNNQCQEYYAAIGSALWGYFISTVTLVGWFIHEYREEIIASFTVILAVATWRLWLSTRDLVRGAKNTSERELRAYVGLEKLSFEIPNENNPDFVIDLDTPGIIHDDFIAVKMRNFGATPATDVCAFVYAALTPPHERLPDGFLQVHDRDQAPVGPVRVTLARFLLHPKQIEITKTIFNPHVVRDARAGLGKLYVFGRIYYRDVYGRPWRTRFCYVWEPGTVNQSERFVAYEQYNGEDQIEL